MSDITEVQSLEQQREAAKVFIERRQMAQRLYNNPDFRKLIVEGFMKEDAARYVQESGDPALTAEERQDALNIAQASGHLKRFLSVTIQMGAHHERQAPDLDREIELARQEEFANSQVDVGTYDGEPT